jgi:small conductance mechanosensitive channel
MNELMSGFSIDFGDLAQRAFDWLMTSGVRIILVAIGTLIVLRIARLFSSKIFGVLQKQYDDEEFLKRTATLNSVIRYIVNTTIIIIAGLILLGEFGIEIGPILAAAGVLGLAVGFGAQSLVKDVISGFFILLEDQIRVGDVVSAAGRAGIVEKINLRTTILRDVEAKVHYIPNGSIDIVTNMTKNYSGAVFDIGVAYREDVDQVMQIIKSVSEELQEDSEYSEDILQPLEIFGLDKFGDSAVQIKARFKTGAGKQWRISREFNRRLKKRFDAEGIEIPFPHMTMYMGKDKDNQSPPLNVLIESQRIKD